jgi:CSLREA domain-containing protein
MRAPLVVTVSLSLVVLLAPAARAETFTVETTGDTSGNPADCMMPAGTCTLRAAIVAAAPGDTIVLGAGTYENTGNDFTIGIDEHVSIVGAGARATTVSEVSGGDGRVFLVEQDARLELTSLTVSGSRDNAGVLLFGGGNALTATRVAFSGNTGASNGGAVDGTDGAVTLLESTVSGNSATASGGGLYVDGAAGTLSLSNSTVTGNSAPSGSGIAVAAGQATLTRTTLAGNSGAPDLFTGPAPAAARLEGSIAVGCSGSAPSSLGFNLDAGGTCGLGGQGDRTGDPLLGPLAAHGGETDTLALGAGSPAVDAGGPCPPPATDQRGVARPQGAACDAGAFEAQQVAPAPRARLTALRVRRISRRAFRVSYRLNRVARVRFRVQRALPGRRVGRRCVPPRAARPRSRPCRRWKLVRAFAKPGRAGRNVFRMRARGLPTGRYRLVARPAGGTRAVVRFRP